MVPFVARAHSRCAWHPASASASPRLPASTPLPPPPPPPQLAALMRAVQQQAGSALAFPEDFAAPLRDLGLDTILAPRAGLPRLAAALSGTFAPEPLRVCYLGGSVTEQRAGYRPRVSRWLEAVGSSRGVRLEEVPAFCGNCGSKVLAFMVADWVVSRRPDLVVVELAINDGDTLLETDDAEGVGSALEGIVRHVRDALPGTELVLLYMFVRDDLPRQQRTGSKAWTDNDDAAAADTYHERVPRLHDRVAERYGVPSLGLSPMMARVPSALRQLIFRDDCHMHEPVRLSVLHPAKLDSRRRGTFHRGPPSPPPQSAPACTP
jgi:lysophospholipase L1-like esterase